MTKKQFKEKYNLTDNDYTALLEYERVRASGVMNMFGYFSLMKSGAVPGDWELAKKIMSIPDFYGDFLKTIS